MKYTNWTTLAEPYKDNRVTKVLCRCKCGTEREVNLNSLKQGRSKSCGCLHARLRASTHGMSNTAEYLAWKNMKSRCYNNKNKRYKNYGGRGIKVCDSWKNDFEAFYAYIGSRPTSRHSLDRIRVNEDYKPGNVRWATPKAQARNTTCNKVLVYKGKSQCLSAWSEELGISISKIASSLSRGNTIEEALTKTNRNDFSSLTYKGKTKSLSHWCKSLKLPRTTVRRRLLKDEKFEDIVTNILRERI